MGLARSLRAVVGQLGGLQDDVDDYYDDDTFEGPDESESGMEAPRRERGSSADFDEIYRDEPRRHSSRATERGARPLALVRPSRLVFSLVTPQDFAAAQQIADHLRAGNPVVVDLQDCSRELSERLVDFCSGLAYALEGRVQSIGDALVLLVPNTVALSSEAVGGLQERPFYNQL
jgi:cell division inhibitor SepF